MTTNSALVRAERVDAPAHPAIVGVRRDERPEPTILRQDQWEAMQRVLTVGPANRSSTLTEAERQRILRHQLMIQQGGSTTTALEAAQKLQIERQLRRWRRSVAASSASARPVPSTVERQRRAHADPSSRKLR